MVGEGAGVVSANDHGLLFHSVPTDTADVVVAARYEPAVIPLNA